MRDYHVYLDVQSTNDERRKNIMKLDQLKDIVANSDLDVYIERKDYITIARILRNEGVTRFTGSQLIAAVDDLADNDPIFVASAANRKVKAAEAATYRSIDQ